MAVLSCGIEAETFGSLMMFASGDWVSAPSSARLSGILWASVRFSGKLAMMRPASEISRVSTMTPVPLVNARTIGRNEYVARAGASSICVQMIVDGFVLMLSLQRPGHFCPPGLG